MLRTRMQLRCESLRVRHALPGWLCTCCERCLSMYKTRPTHLFVGLLQFNHRRRRRCSKVCPYLPRENVHGRRPVRPSCHNVVQPRLRGNSFVFSWWQHQFCVSPGCQTSLHDSGRKGWLGKHKFWSSKDLAPRPRLSNRTSRNVTDRLRWCTLAPDDS